MFCRSLFPRLCEGAKLFLVSRRSQEHLVTCAGDPSGGGLVELDPSEAGSPPKEEEAQNSISLFSANIAPGAGLHVGGGGCSSISSCSKISPHKARRGQHPGRGGEPHSRNHTGRGQFCGAGHENTTLERILLASQELPEQEELELEWPCKCVVRVPLSVASVLTNTIYEHTRK